MLRRGLSGRVKLTLAAPPFPPANTVRPVVSGATGGVGAPGDTFSVTDGTWDNSPTSFTYQWKDADPVTDAGVLVTFNSRGLYDGTPANLGTAQTQAIGAGETGSLIFPTVTATNAAGSTSINAFEVGIIAGGTFYLDDVYVNASAGGDQLINNTPTSLIYTFADVTIGAADARRQVVMFFSTSGGTAATHTALTANAGAITFTKIVGRGTSVDTASTNFVSAWIANVPTGTTLTAPKLTVSAASGRCGMAVMTHGRGAATTATLSAGSGSTNPPTGTLNVAASGIAVGYCAATGTSPGITATWVGVDNEYIDEKFAGTGSALYRTFGLYTNDAVADTNKTFSTTWYTTTDGVTLSGANFRFVVLAFGAKV